LFIKKINFSQKIIFSLLAKGGWAAAESMVLPILSVLLSPWLLNTIGSEGFGQWALALSLAGFAHMTSAGAGVATMLGVANIREEQLCVEAPQLIKAGVLVAVMTGSILIVSCVLLSPYFVSLVFSKMGEAVLVSKILLLGVLALVMQQIDDVLAGALRGIQRFDLVAKVELVGRPLWAVGIFFAAYYSNNVIFLLYCHLVYMSLRVSARLLIVKKKFSLVFFHGTVSKCHLKKLLSTGKWISVQALGGVMFSTVDKLLVGGLYGSGDLSRYAICTQISQFVHNLQAAALQVITPWVAKNRKINLLKIALLNGSACLIFPFAVMIGSWWLLRMWMGTSFADENEKLLMALMLGTVILAFTIPAHYIALGFGKTKICAAILLIGGALSVMTSFGLAAWGVIAFSMGRLVYGVVALGYFFVIKNFNSK